MEFDPWPATFHCFLFTIHPKAKRSGGGGTSTWSITHLIIFNAVLSSLPDILRPNVLYPEFLYPGCYVAPMLYIPNIMYPSVFYQDICSVSEHYVSVHYVGVPATYGSVLKRQV